MVRFLGLRGSSLSAVISSVCGLCFLCFGYAQGVLGGLLTVPAFLERFPQVDTINNQSLQNAKYQGITVGTWNLGCFASAILTVFIGNFLGRKKILLMGITIWVIGEIVQCSSYSFGQFIAGRFIAGFGNGFTTATVPAYQAECVKSHRKGTILMISAGAFVAAGLALSYWLTFGFAYLSNGSAAWRVPIAFQIVFAVIAFGLLIFMPESPRWLILAGREQEALTVLAALNDEDEQSGEIRDEFLQIKDAILVMSKGSTSSMTSNKDKRNLHRVVLAYFIQVFQQMSGINLILQYFSVMFATQTSYVGWVARLIAACAATEYFIASFVAVVGIDRFWGRRSLMVFGACGMCGCMVLLTVLMYLWHNHSVAGTNIAATVFIFGFATFFAIGWQGMAWLYQVEIVPLRIRGPANALSTSANWLVNFVVVFIAPIVFHNIGYRTYIIFACTNFVIVPLIYFYYPETAYRSLEEVDVLFHMASKTPNPWLSVVKIAQDEPLWFGKKGDVPFDYEQSEWHQRHVRFSSSGTTLGNGANEKNNSPLTDDSDQPIGQAISSPSESAPSSSANDEKATTQKRRSLRNNPLAPKHNLENTPSSKEDHSATSLRGKSWASDYSTNSSYSHDWQSSGIAPPPLRVSRSVTSVTDPRPDTSGSGRTAVAEGGPIFMTTLPSDPPLPSTTPGSTKRTSTESRRSSLPTNTNLVTGEPLPAGVIRIESGRETYLAGGMEVPVRPRSESSAGGKERRNRNSGGSGDSATLPEGYEIPQRRGSLSARTAPRSKAPRDAGRGS